MIFACSYGHKVQAFDDDGPKNLEGYFCPLCMGAIVGAGNMIDPRLLAPVQEQREVEAGTLEVGSDGRNVVINHPDLKPDENGVGHIVFSPLQAVNFACIVLKHAKEIGTYMFDFQVSDLEVRLERTECKHSHRGIGIKYGKEVCLDCRAVLD